MSVEENKALIRQFNEEAFNGHDVKARDRFLGPNFAINGRVVDPVRSRQNFASLFTAFPDFHRTKDDTIAEGDKVVARYTATGTHDGKFMDVPARCNAVQSSSTAGRAKILAGRYFWQRRAIRSGGIRGGGGGLRTPDSAGMNRVL